MKKFLLISLQIALMVQISGFGLFLYPQKAKAATHYYVKHDVGASGDCLSWGTACKTIEEGKNKATTSGDVVEIDGGTYTENALALTSYSGVTFKGSTAVGHNDEVVINTTTYNGFYISADYITIQNVTITGGGANWRSAIVTAAGTEYLTIDNVRIHDFIGFGINFEGATTNFVIKNSYINGSGIESTSSYPIAISGAGSTGTVQSSVIKEYNSNTPQTRLLSIGGAGTNVNIYNSVITRAYQNGIYVASGSTVNIENGYISAYGREVVGGYAITAASGGTVNVSNSVINRYGLNPEGNYTNNVNLGENVTQMAFPDFNGLTINEAFFTISADDIGNLDYANDISQVLDNYGVHLTYSPQNTDTITPSQFITLNDMISRDHDIGSHSISHARLTTENAFALTYSGTDATATSTVSVDGTAFQIVTNLHNDDVGPLDLTSVSYDTIGELCTYLNGLSKYSCVLSDPGWIDPASSTSLASGDVDLSDKAAHNIPLDLRMPSAGGRFFTDELVNSKDDLETGIGGGYTVKSFVYPGQDHNATVMAAVKDAGYEIARGGGYTYDTNSNLLENIGNIYQASFTMTATTIKGSGYDALTDAEKEERIRNFARAYAAYALENGVWASVTLHTTADLNTTEIDWLVDELVNDGVSVRSFQEAIDYIKANWTTGDDINYTRSYPDSYDYSLKYTSPLIDAGTDLGITTDLLGNPVYGTPDIGPYEYQPPYTIGVDKVDITSADGIRIYADGKYRYIDTVSAGTEADLSVTPEGGFGTGDYSQWMDVAINTWNTGGGGNYSKEWSEDGTGLGSTDHIIGDLAANSYYTVTNNAGWTHTYKSNGSGEISFTYDGGYSSHTFNLTADTTPPTLSVTSPTDGSSTTADSITVSGTASDTESGLASVTVDGVAVANPASFSQPFPLNLGVNTITIIASDNAGNQTTQVLHITRRSSPHPSTPTPSPVPPTPSSQPAPSSSPAPSSYRFDFNQSPFFSNNINVVVTALQDILKYLGFFPSDVDSTGYYGPITKWAVYLYQQSKGIVESWYAWGAGWFGPRTRSALNNDVASGVIPASIIDTSLMICSVAFDNDLSIGSSGYYVTALQQKLVHEGFLDSRYITGYFGPITQQAVIEYQQAHNIDTSGGGAGRVGPRTRAELNR